MKMLIALNLFLAFSAHATDSFMEGFEGESIEAEAARAFREVRDAYVTNLAQNLDILCQAKTTSEQKQMAAKEAGKSLGVALTDIRLSEASAKMFNLYLKDQFDVNHLDNMRALMGVLRNAMAQVDTDALLKDGIEPILKIVLEKLEKEAGKQSVTRGLSGLAQKVAYITTTGEFIETALLVLGESSPLTEKIKTLIQESPSREYFAAKTKMGDVLRVLHDPSKLHQEIMRRNQRNILRLQQGESGIGR